MLCALFYTSVIWACLWVGLFRVDVVGVSISVKKIYIVQLFRGRCCCRDPSCHMLWREVQRGVSAKALREGRGSEWEKQKSIKMGLQPRKNSV